MVKLKGVVVFRSHLGLYGTLICIVLVFVGCESRGSQKAKRCSQKRPRVRTSDHRTCCQNLSRHRLWKAETVLEKQSFTCFLILPDEIIGNQIDNVAITKNCQKRPWAARGPIHPWSGALQFCVNVLKHLLGVAQPRLETYHRIKL